MTSGTCIPTFSSQVLKRLYLFYLCDSLHPNVGQSLLQLSPSLHISDTRTRNPANSSILPLCPTIQGWLTGRCPIENFSCFSFFTLDLVTSFLSSCPLEWEWVGIRMSLSLPAFFYHFLRLSKTFCFLVTDWRWRGWDIWWPDECCSQNAAVIKEVELETAKGEVSMDPREERLRSLKRAPCMNLIRLIKQDWQLCAVSGRDVARHHDEFLPYWPEVFRTAGAGFCLYGKSRKPFKCSGS